MRVFFSFLRSGGNVFPHGTESRQAQRHRDEERNDVGNALREFNSREPDDCLPDVQGRNESETITECSGNYGRNDLPDILKVHVRHHDESDEREYHALVTENLRPDPDDSRVIRPEKGYYLRRENISRYGQKRAV